MKVVLFCGGLGLRIREAGENIPKPMVPIGYRPILWHLMRYYAHYGFKDFVLCLGYRGFGERVAETKWRLLELLIELRRSGKRVAGYGAPGKGNTLLNYCGIRTDLLDYTVDRNPGKHGKFLPGTHIPIHPPEQIAETRPDYVLVLPWNLKREIAAQLAYVRDWGARLIVPIPEPEVLA